MKYNRWSEDQSYCKRKCSLLSLEKPMLKGNVFDKQSAMVTHETYLTCS